VCPKNVTIISSTGTEFISGDTMLTCTSGGGLANVTYQWFVGSIIVQNGSQYNIKSTGAYSLTCVATYATINDTCSVNKTVSGTAYGW
jgi:hypothetical protein